MKYLALDTCGTHMTVAVKSEEEEYVFFEENCGVKHSAALMPAIERLLGEAELALADLDFIAAVVGAGSFTGIRIGIATVKALCFAADKPCLGVTSFDVLAYDTKDGNVLAAIDAGHGCYYARKYENFSPVTPAMFVDREKFRALAAGTKTAIAGGAQGEKPDLARGLVRAVEAKSGEATKDLDSLEPLYVRKSQAEEGR